MHRCQPLFHAHVVGALLMACMLCTLGAMPAYADETSHAGDPQLVANTTADDERFLEPTSQDSTDEDAVIEQTGSPTEDDATGSADQQLSDEPTDATNEHPLEDVSTAIDSYEQNGPYADRNEEAESATDEQSTENADDCGMDDTTPVDTASAPSPDDSSLSAADLTGQEESAPSQDPDANKKSDAKTDTLETHSKTTPKKAEGSTKSQLVPNGTYVIATGTSKLKVLDVADTTRPGANVVEVAYAGGKKQAWRIAYDATRELYEIFRVVSGKRLALGIVAGKAKSGANVRLYTAKDTLSQRWGIEQNGSVFRIVSGLRKDIVLEVASPSTKPITNVRVTSSTKKANQRFRLYSTKPQVEASTEVVKDGAYLLVSATGDKVAAIKGGSSKNGANAQTATNTGAIAQRFHLTYHKEGYYEVLAVGNGMALDAGAGGLLPGTNVQQWEANGSTSQRWVIRKQGTGNAYTLISVSSGLALAVANGSAKSGANLQLASVTGSKAQVFELRSISHLPQGIVSIGALAAPGRVVQVKGSSTKSGATLQIGKKRNSLAQAFELKRVRKNEYRIRTASSGGWVTASTEGAGVIQQGNHATKADATNIWKTSWVGGRLVLTNKATGKALALSGGETKGGTPLVTTKASGASAQLFSFKPTSLYLAPGYYVVQSGAGACLDVVDGSTADGANVQAWERNGSDAQCFYLERSGTGAKACYRIRNAYNGKYLTATDASKGANVCQRSSSSDKTQRWVAKIADGGRVSFANASAPSRVLDIAGGTPAKSGNVRLWSATQSNAQAWKLVPTTYNPYPQYVRRAIAAANASSSATSHLIVVDKSMTKVIAMVGSNGNWRPERTMFCSVGAPNTPTVEGSFTVGSRGYSFGSGYTCYYWTQFYADYLFHSVLYNEGTFNIQDGRLGYHISHGCVRMDINDAYWIYSTIPSGTRVLVYS